MSSNDFTRGKRTDGGGWVQSGSVIRFLDDGVLSVYIAQFGDKCVTNEDAHGNILSFGHGTFHKVDVKTVGRFVGLNDKNGRYIFEGDIVCLIMPDGSFRYFEVAIKTVKRTVVSHPDFDDTTATVEITGVVFLWGKYELFPCVDGFGVSDVLKMEIIGNIHDNPEILSENTERET